MSDNKDDGFSERIAGAARRHTDMEQRTKVEASPPTGTAQAAGFAISLQVEARLLRARLRDVAQILVAEVGAEGPASVEDVARRAVAEIRRLRAATETRNSAAEQALNEIAALCGCPEWEYPGQIVRDVKVALARARQEGVESALRDKAPRG